MATTVRRIEAGLEKRNLRQYVQAIERNPATPGEVVVWAGGGYPVSSVREVVAIAQALRDETLDVYL